MTKTILELDAAQDDLVRSVLYSFAMADYDGSDSVSIKGISGADILVNASPSIVNEALITAQKAGLIGWDESRVGAISLTELGKRKFLLVRDDFFDNAENERLSLKIGEYSSMRLAELESYVDMKARYAGLAAFAGELVPLAGTWHARRVEGQSLQLGEGEMLPAGRFDREGKPLLWYLASA
jgi:hypothetical protein